MIIITFGPNFNTKMDGIMSGSDFVKELDTLVILMKA